MKHKTLQDSFLNYYWVNVTERYFDFDGKTSREDYWMFTLWSFVITVIFAIVSAGLLGAIYSIFILFPQTAINVRRYHDLGMSGWTFFVFFILFLVPFVNLIVLLCHIVLMCQPSNAWVMYSKDSISSIQSRKKPKNDSNGTDLPF